MTDPLLAGAIAAPLAQMGGDDGGMSWGGPMMILMIVGMVLFVVLLGVGVVWVVRSLLGERAGRTRSRGEPRDALQALERRLAEGEIDVDEYRERREVLERER